MTHNKYAILNEEYHGTGKTEDSFDWNSLHCGAGAVIFRRSSGRWTVLCTHIRDM